MLGKRTEVEMERFRRYASTAPSNKALRLTASSLRCGLRRRASASVRRLEGIVFLTKREAGDGDGHGHQAVLRLEGRGNRGYQKRGLLAVRMDGQTRRFLRATLPRERRAPVPRRGGAGVRGRGRAQSFLNSSLGTRSSCLLVPSTAAEQTSGPSTSSA